MKALIVDDDDFALSILEETLTRMGYAVVQARDGVEAMEILRASEIRLVVTDWDMPRMNGLELCRNIRQIDLSSYCYIIMLTGREGARQRLDGLCAGADDFLNKPLDPEELLVCLKTAERILSLETRDLALFALAKLAESRDSETGAHVERVQSYARLLLRNLSPEMKSQYQVDQDYVRIVYQTSALHDLGKVGIPDSILLKPGKLSDAEFAIMKTHTIIGAQTLDAALQRFPNARFLQIARDIAATHHERFDGGGYPAGLTGEQIPLCGRIVAVADVYDALTSRRVYKGALDHEQSKAIILAQRGRQFDPAVVDAFLRAERYFIEIRQRLKDEPAGSGGIPLHLPHTPPAGPSPCKILLAEDDPVFREKLRELLAATGEQIFCAEDGHQAVQFLQDHQPRLVVSDWSMPHIDGLELCRYIRARLNSQPVHFIMLTANSDRNRLLTAFDAGVDDFLGKPFDPEEVLARVRAGIRAVRLHDERVAKANDAASHIAELALVNSRLERLSITDELTGLFNRRQAMARLEENWTVTDGANHTFSIVAVDIDHFKQVNDTHGHPAGDIVLKGIARVLRETTREGDVVCRMGGEEFLLLLPSQGLETAVVCAERCRAAVAERTFQIGATSIRVTVSLGVAERSPGMKQIPDLLQAADRAMYGAKTSGRNQIKVAAFEPATPGQDRSAATSSESPTEVSPSSATGETDVKSNETLDLTSVLRRCGNDPRFATAVVNRFRDHAMPQVNQITAALAAANVADTQRAAHTLKSMSAYMGAHLATNLCKQIEDLARLKNLAAVPPVLTQLHTEIERALAYLATAPMPSAA